MDNILHQYAAAIGIDPALIALLIPMAVFLFNFLGRAIPDDAVGFWGFVRKVSKVLGLYLSNRVTNGCSQADLARQVIEQRTVTKVEELTQEMNETSPLPPLFPGYQRNRLESPWFVTVIVVFLATLMMSGCTTMMAVQPILCSKAPETRLGLNIALFRAESIIDSVAREAAIGAIRVSLAQLSKCPN